MKQAFYILMQGNVLHGFECWLMNNWVEICFSAVSLNKLSKLIFFFSEIIALQVDDENSCVELDGLADDNLSDPKPQGKSKHFIS